MSKLGPAQRLALAKSAEHLSKAGHWSQAVQAWQKVVASKADDARAYANLALALAHAGQAPQAIDAYSQALHLGLPADEVSCGIGIVFCLRQQWEVAIENLEMAVSQNSANLTAWSNLVVAYTRLGRSQQAVAAAERVLAVDAQNFSTLSSLGTLCKDAGLADDAIAWFERACEAAPRDAHAISNLLWAMLHAESVSSVDLQRTTARFEPCLPKAPAHKKFTPRAPERALRIGWLSGDIREHAVGHFIAPLLEAMRQHGIEHVIYSNHQANDAIVKRARAAATQWRDTRALSDSALTARIRDDAIDILIDLAGHTDGSRLSAMASRAAPIQMTWLGYPGSSGLSGIDYILVPPDAHLLKGDWCSEMPLALPGCYCPREPTHPTLLEHAPPRRQPDGRIVFGCLNNFAKVSPGCIASWSRILLALPQSSLMLIANGGGDESVIADIAARFAQHGIDAARLDIRARLSLADYIAAGREIDIALDTFPFNGGTTGMDALCLGTPFVTLQGEALHQRMGAALLRAVQLDPLIVDSAGEYEEKAIALARDRARLTALHTGLRQRVRDGALGDVAGFAQAFSALLMRLA